jgi:signal transduction histidine kinase
MLVNLFRTFCLLILTVGVVTSASAQPGSGKIDYCVSKSPEAIVSDLHACTWVDRKHLSLKDFLQPAKWIRIEAGELLDGEDSSKDIAIHIAPHFISSIALFRPIGQGRIRLEAEAGSEYIDDHQQDIIGGYLFVTRLRGTDSTVYLRTESYLTGYVSVTVEPWPSHGIQSQLGLGLHLGALLIIWIYAVSSYLLSKNGLMGRFSLFLTCSLLSVLSGSGILSHSLFVGNPRLDLTVFSIISTARLGLWVLLCQAFLQPYATQYWYKIACYLGYIISLACVVLTVDLNASYVQVLLLSGTGLITVAQVIAINTTPGIDNKYRRLLTVCFLTILFILLAMSIAALIPVFPENLALHLARVTVLLPVMLIASLVIYQNRRSQEDLAAIKNELETANLRHDFNEKLLNERRMMMDMLTHELKNPLATIALASGSVNDQLVEENPDIKRRIFKINQAVGNMDAVIERCNLANTLTESELKIYPSAFDIHELIGHLINESKHPERINFTIGKNTPSEVIADPYLFQIIVANLVENALKYSPINTIVKVSTSQETGSTFRLSISNELETNLVPDIEKMFDRFYRHPYAHNTSGTGLGLFLVRGLCEKLNMSVSCTIENERITIHVEHPV